MKKIISLLTAGVLSCGLISAIPAQAPQAEAASGSGYNYAEAMQKSMFFYQAQQSGPLASWNEVTWRADSMENDYIRGGWFDAGDHIKFALTNAYSSALLAWGIIEFPDGLADTGLLDLYRNNLKYSLDFLVECDLGNEVVYQIGDIGFDHVWWGSAELYENKLRSKGTSDVRPYFTTADSNITGEMAAALAAGYLVFKDCNPTLAATYLEHAINCFNIADTSRCHGNTPASDAMYKSSHFYDELFWAANWLYKATGQQKYLDLCVSDYIPNLGTEDQSTEMKFTWGMCWDDVQQGGTLLYAMNTGDATWIEQFRKHLEYWTTGYNGKQISHTPQGLAWLTNWGSLRHATTTAFLAEVAVKNLYSDNSEYVSKYKEFAEKQVNYCLGDNENNMSYVIGMGSTYPQAWHHRTSSGIWDDVWGGIGLTRHHRHVLYGALVGGPNQAGAFNDVVSSYENTEVAIDYNAGYTACLAALIEQYGGTSDPNFPEAQLKAEYEYDQGLGGEYIEFYMQACINQSSSRFTEVKALCTNHSSFPARTIKDLSYRYYFDLSEIIDAGYSASNIKLTKGYDEFTNVTLKGPTLYSGTVYYIEICYSDGRCIAPTGQSEHQGEVQFRVEFTGNDNLSIWDPTNDYSYTGLGSGTTNINTTDKITIYDGGKLIYGTEPDGTTPQIGEDIIYGDINNDGNVNATDASMALRYAVGTLTLAADAIERGDVNGDGIVNATDASIISRYAVGSISKLPI